MLLHSFCPKAWSRVSGTYLSLSPERCHRRGRKVSTTSTVHCHFGALFCHICLPSLLTYLLATYYRLSFGPLQRTSVVIDDDAPVEHWTSEKSFLNADWVEWACVTSTRHPSHTDWHRQVVMPFAYMHLLSSWSETMAVETLLKWQAVKEDLGMSRMRPNLTDLPTRDRLRQIFKFTVASLSRAFDLIFSQWVASMVWFCTVIRRFFCICTSKCNQIGYGK